MKPLCTCWLFALIVGGAASADPGRTFSLADDPPDREAESAEDAPPSGELPRSRRTQWLMFTASWCAPCLAAKHDFQGWLQRSGWQVDESPDAHIRLVDGDREPELVERWQIASYPTFLLVQDGEVLYRSEGYPGRDELVRRYGKAVESAPKPAGAISIGTLPGGRQPIAELIAALKPLLRDGGTVTVRLDRSGAEVVDLPLGDRLALRARNPLVMTWSLQDEVLTCRFQEPYPQGRWSFGVPVEQSVSAVRMSVSEMVIELPRAPDVRLSVEP